jgi:FlaG/FlaF family flagellin (archaellin)
LLVFLIGCGDAGNEPYKAAADSLTLVLDGGAPVVYIEEALGISPLFQDPGISAIYDPTADHTSIWLSSGLSGTSSVVTFNEHLDISFSAAGTGVYSIASGSASISYDRAFPGLTIVASSGTITVTDYGAEGEHIKGIFSALTSSHSMSGSFSVTRDRMGIGIPYRP